MAIVRELTTVLGTEYDSTGEKQYERGMGRVKDLALDVGKALGLVFSIEKVIEFTKELAKTGEEVNQVYAQLRAIARPMDDVDEAQKQIFDTAQRLGLSYKDTLDTYREFFGVMKESNVPQEQILQTTKNIYEALRVGRATAEQMRSTMEIMGNSFKRGYFRAVAIGGLEQNAPIVLEQLEKYYNVNIDGLRKIAKAGKITADVLVDAFGNVNKELDAQAAGVPQKLGMVFNRIYNILVDVVSQIYKITEASEYMGKIVWWIWEALTYPVKKFTEAVGGLQNVLEILGISLGLVLGPLLIRQITMATLATVRWAIASWATVLPWLALGAAIVAVAAGIQDFVYWTQNKHSLIGTWLGPFQKLSDNFKKLNVFAGFRLFDDLFKGNWKAAFADLKIALTDTKAIIIEITALVGLAFVAWTSIKFANLLLGLGEIATAVTGVGTAVNVVTTSVLGITAALVALLALAATAKGDTAPLTPKEKAQHDEQVKKETEAWHKRTGLSPGASVSEYNKAGGYTDDFWGDTWQYIKHGFKSPQAGGYSLGPSSVAPMVPRVAPGAMGPVSSGQVTNNVQPVFTQNNKIEVNTPFDSGLIADSVSDKLRTKTADMFNSFARDVQVSSPRTEAATQ